MAVRVCPSKIEERRIDALKALPANARKHPLSHIRALAKSIKAFGFNAPVLIDRNRIIVAGHGRVEACRLLGWETVPTLLLDHLTPEQASAYAIADNRLTDLSSWDERKLAEHFKALSAIDLDFDLEAIGFSMGEIDLAIEGLDIDLGEEAPDPDDQPPPTGPPVTRADDLWILGHHKLLCGSALDATAYQRLMGEDRAAVVLTDPPYNVPIKGHVTGKAHHRDFASASGEMSRDEFIAFLGTAMGRLLEVCRRGSVHF